MNVWDMICEAEDMQWRNLSHEDRRIIEDAARIEGISLGEKRERIRKESLARVMTDLAGLLWASELPEPGQ